MTVLGRKDGVSEIQLFGAPFGVRRISPPAGNGKMGFAPLETHLLFVSQK
jgi:hypothetical protein